ncbi:MAG: sigma-54 factor interaction domain-containing protein [Gemmatimonadetes bacterium]|nr:sigma-54 factor interaction domain-containing protein [Gemmatimonadota bacterium]
MNVDPAKLPDESHNAEMPAFIGRSPAILQLRRDAALAGRSRAAVLMSGESGTGKEVLARTIHAGRNGGTGAFIAVNCAALPESLIESELFGHESGAFTGALRAKPGLFEEAHGGTLFLDEIAELAPHVQAKLLRALEEHVVRRVGGTETRRISVRVIAAANRDPATAVAAGRGCATTCTTGCASWNSTFPRSGSAATTSPFWWIISWPARRRITARGSASRRVPRWRSWMPTIGPGMCGSWRTRSSGP